MDAYVNLSIFASVIKRDIEKVISQAATQIPNVVQPKTPVKTGHLKRSWKTRHTERNLKIINSAFYSGYVEDGTSKMGARPMIGPIVPAIVSELVRAIESGTDFNLSGGAYLDPTTQLRNAYKQKYGSYGSGSGYSG